MMEIMQKTRLQYENGDIPFEEIDEAVRVSARESWECLACRLIIEI
jgi:hypothetical protein